MVELFVGCAMWAFKPWQGRHLPDRLARDDQLPAYASWCNAVEGNTTFYGEPAAATVAGWAEQAPPSFRFMFKLPRSITHERRLRQTDDDVRRFLDLVGPLGERADPISIQLPGSFGPTDLGTLATFVRRLRDVDPGRHRFAVEVRHPAFFDGTVAAANLERILADEDVEWITFDTTTFYATPPVTDMERETWTRKPRVAPRRTSLTDRPVVRFIGRDDVDTTVAGWQPWLPIVRDWLLAGRTPTVFIHTPDNVDALPLARLFHHQVRTLVPELAPLPQPVESDEMAPPTLF